MATDILPNRRRIGEINKYDFITPSHDVFKAQRA